jgi:hypothetical protein
MGQDWRPNKAISVELLMLVLEVAALKIHEAPTLHARNRWTVFHAYVVVC